MLELQCKKANGVEIGVKPKLGTMIVLNIRTITYLKLFVLNYISVLLWQGELPNFFKSRTEQFKTRWTHAADNSDTSHALGRR